MNESECAFFILAVCRYVRVNKTTLMLHCIAIDDEPLALDLLEDNIKKVPFLSLVGKCNTQQEAKALMQQKHTDLIFLDVEMPGASGLQFLQSLEKKPLCILVTAHEQYALQAFNLNVVDYLTKPVSFERFIIASTKAFELHQIREKKNVSSAAPAYTFINVDYSLLKIVFADIMWIEGLRDYIKIHMAGSVKPIVTRLSVKAIEEQLPSSMFIRIHKSYIVSKQYLTAIRKNNIFIGTNEFPVGDNYKEAINNLISKQRE